MPWAMVLALAFAPASAAPRREPPADALWRSLEGRLFPMLGAIDARRLPSPVRSMLADRRRRAAACGTDAGCLLKAARWTDEEGALLAGAAAAALAGGGAPIPDDGARAQVAREVAGLNGIIDVYGLGMAPRYPRIDGPNAGASQVAAAVTTALAASEAPCAKVDASPCLALALLDANDRDDAAAFEPLDGGANAAATARARTLDWRAFRYTAIIVPGEGPEEPDVPLSALGKLRVRLAAQAFAEGLAPFVILSGGMVHPRGTRFDEAIEMRRALTDRYGVPAAAIVVEPYARHTTTNLRNAGRRLRALGAPMDRDALIVTDEAQSGYIAGAPFHDRNARELGYQPGTIGARLSPTMLPFRPSPASARIDPADPLDP